MQVDVDVVETLAQIRHQAIRYLSYREHAVEELRIKLLKKFDAEIEIDQVLNDLLGEDLLSEQRYAESYIRARVNKGCGPERIRNELQLKGLSKNVIENAFKRNEIDWGREVKKVWLKKFDKIVINDPQERARQWRFLQYRGFSHEQIKHLFDCYLSGDNVI